MVYFRRWASIITLLNIHLYPRISAYQVRFVCYAYPHWEYRHLREYSHTQHTWIVQVAYFVFNVISQQTRTLLTSPITFLPSIPKSTIIVALSRGLPKCVTFIHVKEQHYLYSPRSVIFFAIHTKLLLKLLQNCVWGVKKRTLYFI